MNEVVELVLAQLPNVGDRKTYAEVYESIPEGQRRYLRNALLLLKRDGRVKPENTSDGGPVLHELVRMAEV